MRTGLLYSFLCLAYMLGAQNLVPNPGFETPVSHRFNKKGAWKKCLASDTPDYFTDSVSAGLFKKYMGGAGPHSGNSFIGMFIYRKKEEKRGEIREFVQAELLRPLQRDTVYEVEAYLHLDAESNVLCDGFAVFFSDTLLQPRRVEEMYEHTPQVIYKGRKSLNSADGWVRFSGSFKAKGHERYMILGNFRTDEQTNVRESDVQPEPGKRKKWFLQPGEQVAYLYVDDVKVIYSDNLNKREPADYLPPKFTGLSSIYKTREPEIRKENPGKPEKDLLAYLAQTVQAKVHTTGGRPDSVNFRTAALKKGQVFHLKNIQFEYDKAEFKEDALPELNGLVRWMREHNTMEIEIRGHTDNHGGQQYNIDLSIARANAVERFLIKNEISKKRIQSHGFGSSRPVDTNDTEEGRARNRRIELIITKE